MVGTEFLKFWTVLLQFSDFEVKHVYEDAERKRLFITLIPTHRIGVCPHCEQACDQVKQRRTREAIQDLPIGCNAVELKVRVNQFDCEHCKKCFTPPIPFLAEGAHATERFMERAAQLIRKSDIANAAQFLGVPEKTLANWYYDYVDRLQQQTAASPPKPIRRLGIDELSLKKKFRQFVAVIIDHDNRRVLDVLENREKATVLAYLKAKKDQGLFAQVEEVTTDMWDAYVEASKEAFGDQVAITIDRFHVMKNFQEGLTKARRELQKNLSPEQKAKLKGSRWWWVTNPENLNAEHQAAFDQLKIEFPELGQLFAKREQLRAIFEDKTIRTVKDAEERLRAWMSDVRKLGLKALETFCKTLTNWMDKIANYFLNRSSNGRTEGLNHGIRAILWRAYGMLNFRAFRLRVLDCFGWAKT